MKKLLLLLTLSFFSAQGLANLDIFSCEIKHNLSIFEDSITDVRRIDSFIFKDEKDRIVFSEENHKRPTVALNHEFQITYSQRDSDTYLNLRGEDRLGIPFKFIYYIKDDYGHLDISFSNGGNIRAMIARCVAF